VKHNPPIARRCRKTETGILALCIALAAGTPRLTTAHDFFAAYVQHAVQLNVSERQVNLMLDLTFFEEWSAKERQAMDADGNGCISRSEVDAYVKRMASRLSQQVKLRVAKREAAIAPLYDPELDLLGNDTVGPSHHRIRLAFFALNPVEIHAGDEIVIEDSLWTKAQALGTSQVGGKDRAAFEAAPPLASGQPTEARLFAFRCLKSPTAKNNSGKATQ